MVEDGGVAVVAGASQAAAELESQYTSTASEIGPASAEVRNSKRSQPNRITAKLNVKILQKKNARNNNAHPTLPSLHDNALDDD